MPIIEMENVSFTYREGSKPALKGIDLKVEEGEFIGVIGPHRRREVQLVLGNDRRCTTDPAR